MVAVAAALMLPSSAKAGFLLSQYNNPSPSGPYGTADVSLVGQTATITFHTFADGEGGNTSGFNFRMGDGSSVGMNVNGAFTFISAVGNDGWTFDKTSSGQVDGWGKFNLTVDGHDGFASSATTITVTLLGDGSWLSANDVLTGNNQGLHVVAHLMVANLDGSDANNTGYITEGGGSPPPPPVPEPASAILLVLGGACVYGYRRRSVRLAF